METTVKNSRKSAWLNEWRIDRKFREADEKEKKLEASNQPVIVDGQYNNEELSGDIKDVSPYVDASTLAQGDIVIVSSKQCEADWPMHFAVFHAMKGEVILIPFNNLSEPAASLECKMYEDAFPFTRVLCVNAMFTADPERLKCWHSGRMSERDIKLMQCFMKHQMAGMELSEEAKERQGFNVGRDMTEVPTEFIEYSNELHILINRLALQVRTF
jgi:hypothetical protein